MKHWNLGNTTIRNPDRIREGLGVLKEHFEGKPFTEKEHYEFYKFLAKKRIIDSGDLSKSSCEIAGRKWAACFNQLGLSIAWKSKGPVIITDVGNALLNHPEHEEEIFLRQFIKYHLPSPIESGSEYKGFNVNPFYVVLKLLFDLENEANIKGITKEEISLYVITCINNDNIEQSKRSIIEYRAQYSGIKGKVKKRELFNKKKLELIKLLYKKEIDNKIVVINEYEKLYRSNAVDRDKLASLLSEIVEGGKGSKTKRATDLKREISDRIKNNDKAGAISALTGIFLETKGRTLFDYADTTVRYTAKTGLLSISGDRIVIKEDKRLLAKHIIDNFAVINEGAYLEQYYSASTPQLPSDKTDFIHRNIGTLVEHYKPIISKTTVNKLSNIKIVGDINALKSIQIKLENEILKAKEEQYYLSQSSSEMIKDILGYYNKILDRSLLGGDAYRPAYLEWTTWRLFLAIDSIVNHISETRNFKIDEELHPIHHAASGKPDMVFEYDKYVIVCEVTLRVGENQWAEEEPVPRHVAKTMEQYDKPVYGIFIAPSIHVETANEYFRKLKHIKGKWQKVNIVPLTIDQIKHILTIFDEERFNTTQLRSLLDSLIELQLKTDLPNEWLKLISKKIKQW